MIFCAFRRTQADGIRHISLSDTFSTLTCIWIHSRIAGVYDFPQKAKWHFIMKSKYNSVTQHDHLALGEVCLFQCQCPPKQNRGKSVHMQPLLLAQGQLSGPEPCQPRPVSLCVIWSCGWAAARSLSCFY